ncbi:MAG: pantetheine-phosphate adenylyltransferase, partial [Balneolaceae bacterium]
MKTTALYPGSFDPLTNGHLDILERATNLFDRVVVTVAVNNEKKTVFTGDERVTLINECIGGKSWAQKVEVNQFSGLLVNHAQKMKANTLIRGVRQISDFEYEFRMALTNKRLAPNVDTVFLMPDEEFTFISASIVKEVAFWGGELSSFVPKNVETALKEKMAEA